MNKTIKLTDNEKAVIDLLSCGINTIDTIAQKLEKKTIAVRGILLSLEKKNTVDQHKNANDVVEYHLLAANVPKENDKENEKIELPIDQSQPTTAIDNEALGVTEIVNADNIHQTPIGTKVEDVIPTPIEEATGSALDAKIESIKRNVVSHSRKKKVNEIDLVVGMTLPVPEEANKDVRIIDLRDNNVIFVEINFTKEHGNRVENKVSSPLIMTVEEFDIYLV